MPPAKRVLATLPFKVNDLVRECQHILESAQKTTERADRWDFICKFHDRSSVLSGEFSRNSTEIVELLVFGKGPAWSTVASKATALSIKDERIAKSVESELYASNTGDSRRNAIDVGGVSFELVRFSDGQRLLKIRPIPAPEVTGEQLTLEQVIALPAAAKKRLTYAKAAKALSEMWNQYPSLGIEMSQFKKGIDGWVKPAGTQERTIQSDINRDGDQLTLMLPERTFLTAVAPNETHVYGVHIEGRAKAVSEFWFCVEGAIAALRPRMKESQRQKVMRKLGSRLSIQPPEQHTEFNEDGIQFSYRYERNRCKLLIGRA